MRVAVVAHPRHPISEPFQGGMEAHAFHLVRGLAARGHDVTLFAAGDSDAGVPLVPILPRHADADLPWQRFAGTAALKDHLSRGLARIAPRLAAGGFDAIHNNTLHPLLPALARAERLPMVTSLHVPPFPALEAAIRDNRAPWSLVSLCSRSHRRSWWPAAAPPEARIVANGIDLDQWRYRPVSRHRHAVWLGRMARPKAPHLAIAAARAAGLPLDLAGPVDDRDYFETIVRPALGGPVRHRGVLTGEALRDLVAGAAILFVTPDWEEPFGLAAIEAMASGTPVAGIDRGAVREVVGEAGALAPAGDIPALARAALAALEIPRPAARARAVRHYGLDRMLEGYERLYRAAREAAGRVAA